MVALLDANVIFLDEFPSIEITFSPSEHKNNAFIYY